MIFNVLFMHNAFAVAPRPIATEADTGAIAYAFFARNGPVLVKGGHPFSLGFAVKANAMAVSRDGSRTLSMFRQVVGGRGVWRAAVTNNLVVTSRTVSITFIGKPPAGSSAAVRKISDFKCAFGDDLKTAYLWDSAFHLLYRVDLDSGSATLELSRPQLQALLQKDPQAHPEFSSVAFDERTRSVFVAIAGKTRVSKGEDLTRFPLTVQIDLKSKRARVVGKGMPIGMVGPGELLTWQSDGMGSRTRVLDRNGRVLAERVNLIGVSTIGGKVLCLGQRAATKHPSSTVTSSRLEILDSRLGHLAFGQEVDPSFRWIVGSPLLAVRLE